MKYVLAWIRANPISVAAVIVALISLGVILYVQSAGSALRKEMADRKQAVAQINDLMRTTATVPPSDPDGDPRTVTLTVNPASIAHLRGVYEKLDAEFASIFEDAVRHSAFGHFPMVDGLFPATTDSALPYEARDAYREAFREMLDAYAANSRYPRLNATPPFTSEDFSAFRRQFEKQYLKELFPFNDEAEVDGLSATAFEELRRRLREAVVNELLRRASEHALYAITDLSSPNFPFDMGAWSFAGDQPTPEQMWEGQMDLWMQRDIAQAIANTNNVGDRESTVLTNPVKRLVRIDIVPGYVGINTAGGLSNFEAVARGERQPRELTPGTTVADPDRRLPENFAIASSGRSSNGIYDVRHLWLTLHVDVQQAPRFFEQLSKVNFMTVLNLQVRDIDEYEALQEGFVYGTGDVVEMRMLIESIWLRRWTRAYMPPAIAAGLGVPPQATTP